MDLWLWPYLGDGNLHFNLIEGPGSNSDFTQKVPDLFELLYEHVEKYNGSISAEHGIGQAKRDLLRTVKSKAVMDTMQAIKSALDPKNLMNPGKIL